MNITLFPTHTTRVTAARKPLNTIMAWVFLMLLLPAAQPLWAGARASVDRQSVNIGDSVTLTIETDGADQTARPDLAPLQQDFDVISSGSSTQVQIINGRKSEQNSWIVALEPKHLGDIRIPPLHVGNSTTQPLTLTVEDAPQGTVDAGAGKVFIEAKADTGGSTPYVQQQIQYSVRLYYDQPIMQAELTDPAPSNAVVERLGEDRHYQTRRNGHNYQVLERRYAVFAENSGALTIPPVLFKGQVAGSDNISSPFSRMDALMNQFANDSFFNDALMRSRILSSNFFNGGFSNGGQRITARSESITLDVKPQPGAFNGAHWLPSEQVSLMDDWTENLPQFRVGEPVTRTVTIEAKGLAAAQLPQLEIETPAQMRTYPEKPVISSNEDHGKITGQSVQSIAYVPSQAGQYKLPEIRLPWWDVTQNKQRVAVLPAREINVLAGSGTTQQVNTAPVNTVPATTTANTEKSTPVTDPARDTGRFNAYLPWIVGGFAGLLTLAALLGIWVFPQLRKRRAPKAAPTTDAGTQSKAQTTTVSTATVTARKALQQACDRNNPQAAAAALLQWASVQWPEHPPRNLGALAARASEIAPLLQDLDRTLYAPQANPWNGEALWLALKNGWPLPNEPTKSSTRFEMASLYPPH